jgi:hypothetical protein
MTMCPYFSSEDNITKKAVTSHMTLDHEMVAEVRMVRVEILYILESNPHPFYSFRGLKNQIQIRFAI